MKTLRAIKGLATLIALLITATAGASQPVTIFAAASLQGPLDKIVQTYPHDTTISYAGSGTIARQISLGAPADVVMLASPEWMEWLADRDHLHGTPQNVTSNRLVLIGPAGADPLPAPDARTLLAQLGDGRLAMGHHSAVPAGVYATAWLRSINAWDRLRPHLAETENVRAALALVARAETPLGLVYQSDAQADPEVSIRYTVPHSAHPAILYPIAAVTPAGDAFVAHVMSARATFGDAGFVALP